MILSGSSLNSSSSINNSEIKEPGVITISVESHAVHFYQEVLNNFQNFGFLW